MSAQSIDILILSNGPGEVTTWVRPVVKALRQQLGEDRSHVRVSVVLSPCPNASGKEVAIARSYPEVDRVQGAEDFFSFLLWGKTVENWDWCDRGVVIFLGGDQFFTVIIGKRLGYRTIVYAEWEARWHQWIDRFGVMKAEAMTEVSPQYIDKFAIVGDLMAEVAADGLGNNSGLPELIGILPGSKAAKLAMGLPFMLAVAESIRAARPETKFVIPVAPTLDILTLASFADVEKNPVVQLVGGASAKLVTARVDLPVDSNLPSELSNLNLSCSQLETAAGLKVSLWTRSPAYDLLSQCHLCITTIGANTAELAALAVPMIVVLPTYQLDAMRAWDGLPGLLANLPVVGSTFAKIINWIMLRKLGLLAWPNIWAKAEIVPELVGRITAQEVADLAIDFLTHPEKLQAMRDRLRAVRGESGASQKLAKMAKEELEKTSSL